MTMRLSVLLASLTSLSIGAPALADSAKDPPLPIASRVAYNLPSATMRLKMVMTLRSCAPFSVQPDVQLTSVLGPEAHDEYRFVVDAKDLESFWKDKSLGIDTYPTTGGIRTLNGGVTDQTSGILTSILKAVTTFAGLGAGTAAVVIDGTCNAATLAALKSVDALAKDVRSLRPGLASVDVSRVAAVKVAIDAKAAEIARLRTEELRLEMPTHEWTLDRGFEGGHVRVRKRDLIKWIGDPGRPDDMVEPDAEVPQLRAGLCLESLETVRSNSGPSCDTEAIDKAEAKTEKMVNDAATPPVAPDATSPPVDPAGAGIASKSKSAVGFPSPRIAASVPGSLPIEIPGCAEGPACGRTLVFREPVQVVATLIAEGAAFAGVVPEGELKRHDLPVPQWGSLSYLPLKAGFGKSYTFSMSFDEAGRKTGQSFSHKASGAALASGAAGIVDASANLYKTTAGRDLAEQKAELDALTTRKNLNAIRFCQEVIAAGGFTCPSK